MRERVGGKTAWSRARTPPINISCGLRLPRNRHPAGIHTRGAVDEERGNDLHFYWLFNLHTASRAFRRA